MTDDLRAYAALSSQAGDGDNGCEDAANVRVVGGARRVGEETAVFGFYDVDGEVGMGLCEFGG